ncbi:MAG: N-acetylmuramoyl-L-alanine amidase [Rhodospirillaceae bacterium]|nr:N-acetylmuramoyl-L-alanine amidase [Rhodospirillaceae bacterium]
MVLFVVVWACAGGSGGIGSAHAAATVVTDIRIGSAGNVTRIVFEFTERLSARVFALADPYRVVIDLPEVGWRLPPKPLPAASGVYDRLRYGLYKPGNSRVVLDLNKPATLSNAALIEPNGAYGHRLVLELAPSTRAAFLTTMKGSDITIASPSLRTNQSVASLGSSSTVSRKRIAPKPQAKQRATAPPTVKQARFQRAPRKPPLRPSTERYTVVIDPGHGGVDPGTIGNSGVYEKHVTLAMARAIRAALEKSGRFNVKLTRDRDIFIRLRDRIRRARDAGAKLFISIHADSIKNSKISGPSVYTLSERASDKEAAALADKENKADLIAGIDLTHQDALVADILIDLAQRESMNKSARFAEMLVGEMKKRTKVLRNTHRFAGFAVLKAPDVPSVLLELGFLSNPQDERALRDRRYRARMAAGVAEAVDAYFARIEQASDR